jgi:hypothetical protein
MEYLEMVYLYIIVLSSVFVYFIIELLKSINSYLNTTKRTKLYTNYQDLKGVLDQSKVLAYKHIFNVFILVDYANNIKTTKEDISKLNREYIKVLIRYIGSNILEDLTTIYGSKDSVIEQLSEEFIQRVISDEGEIFGNNNIIESDTDNHEESK